MLKFCKEMLQFYEYSIYSKNWLLVEETSTGEIAQKLCWFGALNTLKDFILIFFFSEKPFLNLYTNTCFFSFRWMSVLDVLIRL